MYRELDIPRVGVFIYHGSDAQNTIHREFDTPWVSGQNTMGRGVKIP
jgi:hypothetical protein